MITGSSLQSFSQGIKDLNAELSKTERQLKDNQLPIDKIIELIPTLKEQGQKLTSWQCQTLLEEDNTSKELLNKTFKIWEGIYKNCNDQKNKQDLISKHLSREGSKLNKAPSQMSPSSFPKPLDPEFHSGLWLGTQQMQITFYEDLITHQHAKLFENCKDPHSFYKAIENLFYAAICLKSEHMMEKLAVFITKIPDVDGAKYIIDKLFGNIDKNFKIIDPQFARKFGLALAAALMNIAEQEENKNEAYDMARATDRNSTEAALKRIFIKVLLSDKSARDMYESVVYPEFRCAYMILWMDHYQSVYLEETLKTKDQNPDKMSLDQKYLLSIDAFKKLKKIAEGYHKKIGTRPVDAYKKIWPAGLKAPFNGFFKALERLTPPTDNPNVDHNKENDIILTANDGMTFRLPIWKVGQLAIFGAISMLRPILNVWMKGLEENFSEKYIFDNQELLRESLKKLLNDPSFYLSFSKNQNELKKIKPLSEDLHIKYTKTNSTRWKEKLKISLNECLSKIRDEDERKLYDKVNQLLEDYRQKDLPSRSFELNLSQIITEFKNKKIAQRIRALLTDSSLVKLVQALPDFEFSEQKKERTNETTLLFDAIIKNNPDILSKLANQEFVEIVKDFLKNWGENLQNLLQKNKKLSVSTALIEWGLFKNMISNLLQKEFKLPISVSELPMILEGMQELPDRDLVELFKGYADNSDIKEALNGDVIHHLLYDTESYLANELETFMINEDFLSDHFDLLSQLVDDPDQKKKIKSEKESWKSFIQIIIKLLKKNNFIEFFNQQWKDGKTSFKKQLKAIALNPAIYKEYNPLIIFTLFKSHHKEFNKTDEELLLAKVNKYISDIYELPTLTAAKKIRGGDKYDVTPASEFDGPLKKFTKEMEIFGANGLIKDHKGNDILYHKALAGIDASFLDMKEIEGTNSLSILSTPPPNTLKKAQVYLALEIDSILQLIVRNPSYQTRELWQYVLQLAIEADSKKYITHCLDMMNDPSLGMTKDKKTLTAEDLEAHFKFIQTNKIVDSCKAMLSYFALKLKGNEKNQDHENCHTRLNSIFVEISYEGKISELKKEILVSRKESGKNISPKKITASGSSEITLLPKEQDIHSKSHFQAILEPSLTLLKSCLTTLPNKDVADFFNWALDSKNPLQKDYLQVTSITQTIQLMIAQFSQLVNNEDLKLVLPQLNPLIPYFFFEVDSDHLEMGLADPSQEKTGNYQLKLASMMKFNTCMIETLKGIKQTQPLSAEDVSSFSIYQQSLSPKEMKKILEAYQNQTRSTSREIEYSFFSRLQLNIEAGRRLLETLKGHILYSLFQQSLIARYSAMLELLPKYKELLPARALELGKDTILVVPTLTYCIAAYDKVKPIPKLEDVIKDKSLEKVLHTAATLVRLLNDNGTHPLTDYKNALEKFEQFLKSNNQDFLSYLGNLKLRDFKMENLKPEEELWSRIIKDTVFGEHNICLDSIRKETDSKKAWKTFQSTIHFFSKNYRKEKEKLTEQILLINKALGDDVPGQLILNFVLFHEKLYSKNAMTEEGEYAIAKENTRVRRDK